MHNTTFNQVCVSCEVVKTAAFAAHLMFIVILNGLEVVTFITHALRPSVLKPQVHVSLRILGVRVVRSPPFSVLSVVITSLFFISCCVYSSCIIWSAGLIRLEVQIIAVADLGSVAGAEICHDRIIHKFTLANVHRSRIIQMRAHALIHIVMWSLDVELGKVAFISNFQACIILGILISYFFSL